MAHNFTVRYPPRSLRLEHPGDAAWFIAVEPNDRLDIVGWSRIERDEHRLFWFAVRSYIPRIGIGRACLAAACAWADGNGLQVVLTSKPELVDWYATAGFVETPVPTWLKMAAGQSFMVREPLRFDACVDVW